MARTADHDVRRRQVITGVRVVARHEGLGRVTMAKAADAAGVSVGLVQHYFASKEELLIDTASAVRLDVLTRSDAATGRSEALGARIESMLVDGLAQLLPLDNRRRDETYLMHAFAGLALEHAPLQRHLRTEQEKLLSRIALALENGKACGEVAPDTDVETNSYATIALTEGLAARLLIQADRRQRAWATAALADQAARLCPARCTHYSAPTATTRQIATLTPGNLG